MLICGRPVPSRSVFLAVCADADGSIVRQVRPDKPAGPYLIGSFPDWWRLHDTDCWWEVSASGATKLLGALAACQAFG